MSKIRKASPFETKGYSGAVVYSGYVQQNEKDSRLIGTRRYVTFSEMLANTAIVSAGVRYFLNIVSKPVWRVEPADDSEIAEYYAELVESMLYDMDTPWFKIIRRASLYRFYGFSVQEWTAKLRPDGVIGMKDIAPRPQATIERWDVDERGHVHGVYQASPVTFDIAYIPRNKLVYIVDDTLHDSPEGLGLFRHLVSPTDRLRRYEELEGFGYEADLRGIPVARAPLAEIESLVQEGKLSRSDANALKQPLTDFVENHIRGPKLGLLLDSMTYQSLDESATPSGIPQWDVKLLEGSNANAQEVAAAIHRVSLEIARILGVENLLIGGDGSGSLALSRDKSYNFYLLIEATLNELVESFEHDFIDPIWRMNGFDPALKPSFKTDSLRFRDAEQLTAALRDVAQAGVPLAPDDPAINEIRDHLGLSHATIDHLATDAALLGPALLGEE